MNLALLKTFIAVVKHDSVSRASQEVFLTQPAATKQIRTLEQIYGTKLFERKKNRLFLTHDGTILLNYAHKILALYDESRNRIDEEKDYVKGSLKLGANLTLGVYVLPKLMKIFKDIYPDVEPQMILGNTLNVIGAIKRRDVNFGFIGKIPDEPDLINNLFHKDRLKIVISPKLSIKKTTISWKELEKIPFISREKGSDIRETYEDWSKDRPIKITPKLELNSTEAIKMSIQCGFGFSILPWCTIEQEVQWGSLKTLSAPYFDPLQQFYISYYVGSKFSKTERTFMQFIFNFIEKGELPLPLH